MQRFGVSSWPHLLFVNPASGKVVAESGRSVQAVLATARRAQSTVPKPLRGLQSFAKKMKDARAALAAGKRAKAKKLLKKIAARKDPGEFFLEARDLLESMEPGRGENRKYTPKDLADPDFERRADAVAYFKNAYPKIPFVREALPLLSDADAAVRLIAAEYVAAAAPKSFLKHAGALLSDRADQVKAISIEALRTSKNSKAASSILCKAWRDLDGGRLPSRNPNVLRWRLAGALEKVGHPEAVALLGPQASSHAYRNGTTKACVKALGEIGKRHGAAHVLPTLRKSFPPVLDARRSESRIERSLCLGLAQEVHKALVRATGAKGIPGPSSWSAKEAARVVAAWKRK